MLMKDLLGQVQYEINVLRRKLANTDYVALKIAEGEATKEEYAEILEQRKLWRAKIDALMNTDPKEF